MIDIKSLLKPKQQNSKDSNIPTSDGKNLVADLSNWYSDRYGIVLIQRNILLVFVILSLGCLALLVVMLGNIATTHKIEPLVIQIEQKTGIPSIVNPLAPNSIQLTGNDALNRYFILKYIKSRETYCDFTYQYNYLTIVRLLSASDVYWSFINFVNNSPNSPLVKYASSTCTDLEIRSLQNLGNNQDGSTNIQVRFEVFGIKGQSFRTPKIATLKYKYQQNEMSFKDRSVNPLGFMITEYVSDNEVNLNLN
jgi:type IV secretion system protein VirB8